jgi:hypothetical protein
VRKAWKALLLRILKALGQQEYRLNIGVRTQFRGRKNELFLPEYQEIAEVFKRTPDLEDYWRIRLEDVQVTLRKTPITAEGDRQRLVLQAQAEVLQDCLNLPEAMAERVKRMLKPKAVPNLKGSNS